MTSINLALMRSARRVGGVRRASALIACLSLASVTLAACGGDDDIGTLEGTDDVATIKITNPANISNVPLHIAIEEGYFEEEGLEIEADIDLGAGSTVEAVIGGQVDMAWVNLGGALAPYSEGIDLRLVSVSDQGTAGGMEVLVKDGSPYQDITDLVGKTMAVLSPSTTCVWLVKKALLEAGEDVDAIKMTEVSPPDHPTVLESGNVDATCTTDPTRTVMHEELNARAIFDAASDGVAELQAYPVGGYVVSGEFADGNPETLAAFKRAILKAAVYANANPEEVRAELSNFTTADPEVADKVIINHYVESGDLTELRSNVELVAQTMVETGILESVPDLDTFLLKTE